MTYRVVRGGIPIMKNHLGEVVLEPDGAGTRLIWRCRFDSRSPASARRCAGSSRACSRAGARGPRQAGLRVVSRRRPPSSRAGSPSCRPSSRARESVDPNRASCSSTCAGDRDGARARDEEGSRCARAWKPPSNTSRRHTRSHGDHGPRDGPARQPGDLSGGARLSRSGFEKLAERYRAVRRATEALADAALGRGLRRAVDAGREPVEVAPRAHHLVLRDLRARAPGLAGYRAVRPALPRALQLLLPGRRPSRSRARSAALLSRPTLAEVLRLPRATSTSAC